MFAQYTHRPRARRALAGRLVLLACLGGCRKDTPTPREQPSEHAAAEQATKPATHLAPGELLEGELSAFGVRLPRGFQVRGRFPHSVLAYGAASAPQLSAYVQARVRGGQAELRSDGARFSEVRAPSEPDRPLQVLLTETAPGLCELQINDVTPPADLGGTVAERMRRAGRDERGQMLDRTKAQ